MERFSFIFLVAGLGFFVLAFVVSGWLPLVQFHDLHVASVKELTRNVPVEFVELREDYPEAFKKAFGDKSDQDALAEAIVEGKNIYIGEACWHCHSQFIRPVGGDEARFGRISQPAEYNNDMNFPPMWGTRRIGPDLTREGGKRSNDWHVAHFWNPPDVSPTSVMPRYPWFFEADGKTPNRKGMAIIAYLQWLGSAEVTRTETVQQIGDIERSFPAPVLDRPAAPKAAPKPAKPAANEDEE